MKKLGLFLGLLMFLVACPSPPSTSEESEEGEGKEKSPAPEDPEDLLIETEREISMVVVHHSATERGNVEIFRQYHVKSLGWDDIGYHFVITNGDSGPDGEIQIGRPLDKDGAHARGRNEKSIGICLVGNSKFTDKQIASLQELLGAMCSFYDIEPSRETIQRHHNRCPGPKLDLKKIRRHIAAERKELHD